MKIQNSPVLRKLYTGFSALIGMLLILMAAAFVSFGRMQEANRWSTHTYEVLRETHAIAERLFNIDTVVRGYALTNSPRFLQPS